MYFNSNKTITHLSKKGIQLSSQANSLVISIAILSLSKNRMGNLSLWHTCFPTSLLQNCIGEYSRFFYTTYSFVFKSLQIGIKLDLKLSLNFNSRNNDIWFLITILKIFRVFRFAEHRTCPLSFFRLSSIQNQLSSTKPASNFPFIFLTRTGLNNLPSRSPPLPSTLLLLLILNLVSIINF